MGRLSTLPILCFSLIVAAQVSSANPFFGSLVRKAFDAGERSADEAAELALRSGRVAAVNGVERTARRQADIESALELFKNSPPDVKQSALRNADPNLLIDNPQLATALGLEEVLRANPRIVDEILPSTSQIDLWTPEEVVRRYSEIAASEAAKPSPAFRLDVATGKLTLTKSLQFGGVEYTGVEFNLYHATALLAGACVAFERCRGAVIDLGAIALLEAAAKLEN
ncbi:hypothetical protein [uncultured Roseobacter sp.]|uniref:hypothetical protein n=1 Tax=uncultured Roseobacter sp. TaxID=114847 RepID=UPI00263829AC|nr:hypothetical protein [uncultured Roseobacter sp.]